jgi:hypothetical protein
MDNFVKINNLFKELKDELSTLKSDLVKDVNYSVSHAEIVTSVESVEESLHEVERQVHAVEHDVDTLNEILEHRAFENDDEDEHEARGYSRVGDDDDDF